MSLDPNAINGSFATLEDLYNCPEKIIGTSNFLADLGIMLEHCERRNANSEYTTPNYKVTTLPMREYWFVVNPGQNNLSYYHHTPRDKNKWRLMERALRKERNCGKANTAGIFWN